MGKLVVNSFGMMKAEKFRRHFRFSTDGLVGESVEYMHVHDYLHTVTGATPTWHDNQELRVVEFEDAIRSGLVPIPRGLRWENHA